VATREIKKKLVGLRRTPVEKVATVKIILHVTTSETKIKRVSAARNVFFAKSSMLKNLHAAKMLQPIAAFDEGLNLFTTF